MPSLQTTRLRAPALLLAAALNGVAGFAAAQSTVVRVQTTQGAIDLQLLDAEAPLNVANFLAYVRGGDFVDSLFSRSIPGFVIQGGGYRWPATGPITLTLNRGAVANEFSATRSNVRGTVAMAKNPGKPDSATNEWFVNLADNSQPCPTSDPLSGGLDCQNGGFTVFARVSTAGMAVVDSIAALPRLNAASLVQAWTSMPVSALPISTAEVLRSRSVLMTQLTEFPAKAGVTDADRIFNHLEKAFPSYTPQAGKLSGTWEGYTYRFYPEGPTYVGIKDNQLWYLLPNSSPDIGRLGTVTDWLVIAATNGS